MAALAAIPYLAEAATVLSTVSAAKNVFGSKGSAPQPKAPAVMPTGDDLAVKAAERKRRAALAAASGRASTVLSQDEALGG